MKNKIDELERFNSKFDKKFDDLDNRFISRDTFTFVTERLTRNVDEIQRDIKKILTAVSRYSKPD